MYFELTIKICHNFSVRSNYIFLIININNCIKAEILIKNLNY